MLGEQHLAFRGAAHQLDQARVQGLWLSTDQFTVLAVFYGEKRHFQTAERAQFFGNIAVDGKAHDHAADRQWRENGGLHQQMRVSAAGHNEH